MEERKSKLAIYLFVSEISKRFPTVVCCQHLQNKCVSNMYRTSSRRRRLAFVVHETTEPSFQLLCVEQHSLLTR